MAGIHRGDDKSKKLQYIKQLYTHEDEALKATNDSLSANGLRPINLDIYEAKIVQILLKLHNARKVVEIGTLAGYSAINIARALSSGGILYTFEKEEKTAAVAQNNINNSDVKDRITVIVGDAHANLKTIENEGPFDAIFIDAEKQGYPAYLEWANHNLRKNGLIIADNTFLFGAVYDTEIASEEAPKLVEAMKNFNNSLADTSKYDSIILPTVEGLTVSIKKF